MPKFLVFTIFIAAFICPNAVAQDDSQVQRLLQEMGSLRSRLDASDTRETRLQNRVDQLEGQLQLQSNTATARIAQLENQAATPTAARELEEALAGLTHFQSTAAAKSRLSVGGYFDTSFRDDHTKDSNTFAQHRLVLKFNADIMQDLISFRTEIEFEGGGAGASFLSGNEVLVEYAELHFHINRAFNIKAGILLVPFGRFNILHDSPLRDLTDRPLVNRRIIPSTWGDAGVGIYGAWSMLGLEFDYDIALINGLDEDFSATKGSGFRGNRNSFRSDNNDSKMVVGRLGIRANLPFFEFSYFGLSAGWGKYDDLDDQNITIFAFDWNLKRGDFEFLGEYTIFDLDQSAREFALGAPAQAEGFYAQVNYHFFPDSWRGISPFFTEESTFTLVFRVGNIDTDDSQNGIDRNSRGVGFRDDTWRYTVGLNFRPIEKTVIKIEYQFWGESGGIEDADNDRFVISFATYF